MTQTKNLTERERRKRTLEIFDDLNRMYANEPCGCICHREPLIKHIFVCCTKCEYCRLNVYKGGMENHLKYCEKRD